MDTFLLSCPACGSTHRQTKAGKTTCASQRYQCQDCRRFYTPTPKNHAYPQPQRDMALKMYLEDGNFRRIARLLGVAPQTVVNWVNAYVNALQVNQHPVPQPVEVETVEMDELWTFVGAKKNGSTSSPS